MFTGGTIWILTHGRVSTLPCWCNRQGMRHGMPPMNHPLYQNLRRLPRFIPSFPTQHQQVDKAQAQGLQCARVCVGNVARRGVWSMYTCVCVCAHVCDSYVSNQRQHTCINSCIYMGVAQLNRSKPQVLVHFSTYQGNPFLEFRFFEP